MILQTYSELHPEMQKWIFIIFSVVCAVVGVSMIISYFKNKNKNIGYYPGNNLFFGLFFFLWGAVLLVFSISSDISVFFMIFLIFLIIFLAINIVLQISHIKKCTEKIRARLESCYMGSYSKAGAVFYIPVFSYSYNGENYKVRSVQNFRESVFGKRKKSIFPEDRSYCEIYINPNDPRMNIYTTDIRKNIISDVVFIIIFTVLFIIGCIVI